MTTSTFHLTPELPAWLWTLPPGTLLDVLDADGRKFRRPHSVSDYYLIQQRETALHLIVEAPAGQPANAAQFLQRCTPAGLAEAWGGAFDETVAWGGVEGADELIGPLAVGRFAVLPLLLAEFVNTFRHWVAFPEQLRTAVQTAEPGFPLPTLTTDKEN
ncbi:hypothetical protein ABZW96_21460 [Nocardia sp. NPDC004168]|uniref:hypothetical protein n=1 Tax=Nocardia sp. NPDC004168 TaxID=3154452 RepID=UPI00339F74F5